MNALLSNIKNELARFNITVTVQSTNNGKELVLPGGEIHLIDLGNEAKKLLPDSLYSQINGSFLQYGINVLKLDKAYLTSAGTFNHNSTSTLTLTLKWKDATWELIPGLLYLKDPMIKAYVTESGSRQKNTVYVSGSLLFAGIPLEVSVIIPDMIVSAGLLSRKDAPPENYPLTPLLEKFGFQSDLFNGLELNQFSFSASVLSRIFSMDIGIKTDMTIPIPGYKSLKLENVSVRMNHIGGAPSFNDVTVFGHFTFDDDVTIVLSVNHNSAGGWSIYGQTKFAQPITLGSIITAVKNKIWSEITLPESITNLNLSISELTINYDARNKEFGFGFKLSSPASISGITDGVITTGDNNFTSFTLQTSGSGGTRDTKIELKILPGVRLSDLSNLTDDLPIDQTTELKEIDFTLAISSSTGSTEYSFTTGFSDSSNNEFYFKGTYSKVTTDTTTISSFGGNIYSPSGTAISLSDNSFPISMGIKDLFIAKISTTVSGSTKSFTIFGSDLDIDADIDLSSLPVLGNFLKDAKFSFNSLRVVYAKTNKPDTKSISATDLVNINNFLSLINVSPLVTSRSSPVNNSSTPDSFPIGFSLQGSLVLGNNTEFIPLFSALPASSGSGQSSLDPNSASSSLTPSPVGKKFGPVKINSVGLSLSGGKVHFKFSGGLLVGPLALEFIGFEITSPVDSFDPSISLHGLGLGITKPPLSLDGLFVQSEVEIPEPGGSKKVDGFSGSIFIGYDEYALSAIGSYAKLPDGTTSIFLYGFLGAPLGGLPAILYVTGAAAGFGYNRNMTLPAPETIKSYPLIQPVLPGNNPVNFDKMNLDFMPKEGSFWGAIGIRVESFKMIESFVLLSLKFNTELEIDVLGISHMQYPVPGVGSQVPPLARIDIGFVARILPERGVVAVNGTFLPGSYVYNPMAHITGGFAMLSIFKDQTAGQWKGAKEGDFIFTLGGYGPVFKPKPHYPKVPRLEMNWQVSNNLQLKAEAYFAITPEAMMVGGHMTAHFYAGGTFAINVVFKVGADFIIYWKPYHYKGSMHADLHVTASIHKDCWLFTIHASVDFDVGADLNIWGPSFSGYASVHVHVLLSFTVGISFGEPEHPPKPINWSDFKSSFLPAADKILTAQIGKGLVASQSTQELHVVNAKELLVICGSAIPVKTVTGITGINSSNTGFGIKPMANTADDFSQSELSITITKDVEDSTSHFNYEAITKNMPSAMWQPATVEGTIPANNGSNLIENLLCGVKISAKPPAPGSSYEVPGSKEDIIHTAPSSFTDKFSYDSNTYEFQNSK